MQYRVHSSHNKVNFSGAQGTFEVRKKGSKCILLTNGIKVADLRIETAGITDMARVTTGKREEHVFKYYEHSRDHIYAGEHLIARGCYGQLDIKGTGVFGGGWKMASFDYTDANQLSMAMLLYGLLKMEIEDRSRLF